jgi:hypothetical protein
MTTAKVAPAGYTPRNGEGIFSIGCGGGNNPTCNYGRVLSISTMKNLRTGEYDILSQESSQVEEGRSGGGLFTSDGKLIGVLSAADPEKQNTGYYTNLNVIHSYLDKLGLSDLYRLLMILIKFK